MRCKGLVLIQDGLADHPIEALDGLTPLEAADTPVMDRLATEGRNGLMDVVGPGIAARTHVGHLVLFGQAVSARVARGPVEAAGIGVELAPGEIALRFNFATEGAGGRILDRRAGRIHNGTDELVSSLNSIGPIEGVRLRFYAATQHRGVLTLRGDDLSAAVSDSDPERLSHRLAIEPLDSSSEAKRTAQVVSEALAQCSERLENHPVNQHRRDSGQLPANTILTRGAGGREDFRSFSDRFGVTTACVSGEATVLGAARLSGIAVATSPAMTAGLDTDLEEKAAQALECLSDHDLVFLHLKGCDIAAHDYDALAKKDFIERTDRMLGGLIEAAGAGLTIAAVSDHATVSDTGQHSDDPVPVILNGRHIVPDSVTRYGERFASRGGLGRFLGRDFPSLICSYLKPGTEPPSEAGEILRDVVVKNQPHQGEDEDHASLRNP